MTAVRRRKPSLLPDGAMEAPLPYKLAPQLATLVSRQPGDPDEWVFEIKFDGYRLLTRVEGPDVKLFNRNGSDWTSRMPVLASDLRKADLPNGWYDGELVVRNAQGLSDFGALQLAFDTRVTVGMELYLFDILFFDGFDLRQVPLGSRRGLLREVMLARPPATSIRFSEEFSVPPAHLLATACKMGLEGIIGKRRDSAYVSRRSPTWIKLKFARRQEFVIAGYTDPQGSRTAFGSLLLGYHDQKRRLVYAGRVGTGFDDAMLRDMLKKLETVKQSKTGLEVGPRVKVDGLPHWVNPTLVAEVGFREWTSSGHLRHPVFITLRTDKPAREVVRERVSTSGNAG